MTEASQTERETGSAKERYVILSNPNQAAVIDTFTNAALFTYTGPNRLMNALDRHMRLTERWEALQGGASLADLAETEEEPAKRWYVFEKGDSTLVQDDQT